MRRQYLPRQHVAENPRAAEDHLRASDTGADRASIVDMRIATIAAFLVAPCCSGDDATDDPIPYVYPSLCIEGCQCELIVGFDAAPSASSSNADLVHVAFVLSYAAAPGDDPTCNTDVDVGEAAVLGHDDTGDYYFSRDADDDFTRFAGCLTNGIPQEISVEARLGSSQGGAVVMESDLVGRAPDLAGEQVIELRLIVHRIKLRGSDLDADITWEFWRSVVGC